MGVVDHPDGRVIFVPGTWPGDEGEFYLVQIKKSYGFGSLKNLTKASPDRNSPVCHHHGFEDHHCGGCPWMMASYPSQLFHKESLIKIALDRSGLFEPSRIKPILPSQKVTAYRNRAQFKTDGRRLGYVSPKTNKIVDVSTCPILTDQNKTTLETLRSLLPNDLWLPKSLDQRWTTLDINHHVRGDEVRPNVSLEFIQANDEQNEQMKLWLKSKLADENLSSPVLELFCGSGNITQVISSTGFQDILAIEGSKTALTKLSELNLPGVKVLKADLFKSSRWSLFSEDLRRTEVLVLDPPRSGFPGLEKLVAKAPRLSSIFYISCDLQTFIRDGKGLALRDFALREVQPIDFFPHTPHIELLGHYRRL